VEWSLTSGDMIRVLDYLFDVYGPLLDILGLHSLEIAHLVMTGL
jgi:hypothetical protein